MERGLAVLFTLAGAAVVVSLLTSSESDDPPAREGARCPTPRVENLDVRVKARQVTLRGDAYARRGRIGAFEAHWGDKAAVTADIRARRRVPLVLRHTYSRAGTFSVSVVTESAARGCRYKKSPPARLRIRVPHSR